MFREEEALEIAQEFVEKDKLKMSLLGVKRDKDLVTFFFSAPQRVDFRSLSHDLRDIFQTEIRFEEAGPREKARHLGGLGRCGMPLCCHKWLSETPRISLESLEKDSLPLPNEKFTGACGRLLCCLVYEKEGWCKESQKPKVEAQEEKEELEQKKQEKVEIKIIKKVSPRKKRVRKLKL